MQTVNSQSRHQGDNSKYKKGMSAIIQVNRGFIILKIEKKWFEDELEKKLGHQKVSFLHPQCYFSQKKSVSPKIHLFS